MSPRPPRHHYLAYAASASTPNVVVDGSPNAATELVLSHWPGNSTPADLKADLSAEIAFAYLDHPGHWRPDLAVTNNHVDEDGMVSVFALVEPDRALARRERLVEVARAGDFSFTTDVDAARIAFALGAGAVDGYDDLATFAELVDDPDRFEPAWRGEWDLVVAGRADVAAGRVTVTSVPELDLTVVRAAPGVRAPHPMVVYSLAPGLRVVTITDAGVEVTYRYETWVDLRSPHRSRVDLAPLAAELSDDDDATWTYDGDNDIVPRLRVTAGTSRLRADDVVERLAGALAAGDARGGSDLPTSAG